MPTISDINRTTRFEYNLDGNLVKLIAENPTTGDQVTEWIYGVTVAQGSAVESKALVYQKKYPDSVSTADRVTYTYNRLGQVTSMADQAGTTHGYAFDKFGRILEDDVLSFGTDIDETVKKITRSYEVRGMLETVSSIGSGATVLNQVKLTYNAYAQLAKDYQEHSGTVNTGSTLNVAYSYADGSTNTVRRTGITYPDTDTAPTGAMTITTEYLGTDADALSRSDALKEGSDTLCSYRYLGAGVFIGVKYDAASDVELTYQDGGTGDAGDKYTGLDRFGRLIETLWKKGTTAQVHNQYGRNRFGGVVWRKDLTAHAQSVTTEDSFYQYDGLYQVKEHQRGELTGTPPSGITNLQQEEDWTYDATGNWDSYTNSDPTTSQDRTNNEANEITEIINPGGTINPDYDPAGNMLTMPTEPGISTGQYSLKWDAWNRLVEVKDGGTIVASYLYDGLTRRITTTNATETRHYYYNNQWRAVEERVEGASIAVDRQYTWGLRDRWDLLRRKRSTGGSSLNEVHYCIRDYLDPVAIVGTDGLVKERYCYDAFGKVRFLAPDYSYRSDSAHDWNWLFHSEFRDAESRLYNYGYRFYDVNLGRWLSRDPIGEEGGVNSFSFNENAPGASFDYLGLKSNPMEVLDWGEMYSAILGNHGMELVNGKIVFRPTVDLLHVTKPWFILEFECCSSAQRKRIRQAMIDAAARIAVMHNYLVQAMNAEKRYGTQFAISHVPGFREMFFKGLSRYMTEGWYTSHIALERLHKKLARLMHGLSDGKHIKIHCRNDSHVRCRLGYAAWTPRNASDWLGSNEINLCGETITGGDLTHTLIHELTHLIIQTGDFRYVKDDLFKIDNINDRMSNADTLADWIMDYYSQ